jgi:septal ring-binding cell division protein DamX
MQNITRQSVRLAGLIMVFLISACAGTQDKQTQQPAKTFDMVLYSKAKSAFQSGDYKTAASLFDPLAENGNADAQYSLGYMYYHGKGVAKSLNKAMHWFTLSAQQGNQKAIAALNTIESMLNQSTQDNSPASSNASQVQSYPAPTTDKPAIVELRQPTQSRINETTPVVQTRPRQPETVTQSPPTTPTGINAVAEKILTPEKTKTKPLQPETNYPSPSTTPTDNTVAAQKSLTPEKSQIIPVRTPMEIEHRKWIMRQPSTNYTIQLASSSRKKHIVDYVRNVALDGVYFYGETMNSTTRYYVIHGSFETYSKARRKLRLLNKRGYKDAWIRDIKGIRKSLQQQ